jgi:hypothetical protein
MSCDSGEPQSPGSGCVTGHRSSIGTEDGRRNTTGPAAIGAIATVTEGRFAADSVEHLQGERAREGGVAFAWWLVGFQGRERSA